MKRQVSGRCQVHVGATPTSCKLLTYRQLTYAQVGVRCFCEKPSFLRNLGTRQVFPKEVPALRPFAGGKAMDCRHLFDALPPAILNKANITLKGIFRKNAEMFAFRVSFIVSLCQLSDIQLCQGRKQECHLKRIRHPKWRKTERNCSM